MNVDKTLPQLYERGLKCVLWGRPVPEMTREELITFIGFLDELATQRYMEKQMAPAPLDATPAAWDTQTR